MAFAIPVVADFKAKFVRDFPYGSTPDKVNDSDIQSGLDTASFNFNSGLFGLQTEFTLAYLLLSAHFMVMNLRASSQGISGQYSWLQTSKSVGSVAESFQIPQRILDHPVLGMLTKTYYGAQYVMLLLPRLTGQVFITPGDTLP